MFTRKLLAKQMMQRNRGFVSEATVRDVKRMATKEHVIKLVPVS